MKPKFKFYEVVEILAHPSVRKELVGCFGAILGRSEGESGWIYAISITGVKNATCISEEFLRSTGQVMKREDFYTGETVHVTVDPKTGRGKVVE